MYGLFLVTDIIAMVFLVVIALLAMKMHFSRVQNIFTLFILFVFLFVFGCFLEHTMTDSVNSAFVGLEVQYVGQIGFLITFVWFISCYVGIKVPKFLYLLQGAVSIVTVIGVLTVRLHKLFYVSAKITTRGGYNHLEVKAGPIFVLHYFHFCVVFVFLFFALLYRYRMESTIQKKRIRLIGIGFGTVWLELILKGLGVFGNYNPVVLTIVFAAFCVYLSMLRYGYFDSLQVATENALNHGNEGLLILGGKDTILLANERMKLLFPLIDAVETVSREEYIQKILSGKVKKYIIHDKVYEIRVDEIVEQEELSGHMIWFTDMTVYYENMEKLRLADDAKNRFLMRTSHEIRTPINTVLSMNEMIKRESTEENIQSYADYIQRAGKLLLALINDILDLSKIESDTMEVQKENYDISSLLTDIWCVLSERASEKNLKLNIRVENEIPQLLYGDVMKEKQILVNLLNNAIKYTKMGSVTLKISSKINRMAKENVTIIFCVEDTGCGIREEELEKIFEIYERTDEVKRKHIEGTGLGLPIAKKLAELLGGTIAVESTVDFGTRFTVELPQVSISNQKLTEWSEEEDKVLEETGNKKSFQAPDAKILVVDDNMMNRRSIAKLLERTKVQIAMAESGRKAIALCEEQHFNLILMDHMMPGMDGIETFHELQEQELIEGTPVIVLTANAVYGAREFYLAEGFVDYLTKPIEPERLERVIQKYLKQSGISPTVISVKEEMPRMPEKAEQQSLMVLNREIGLKYCDQSQEFYSEMISLFKEETEEAKQELKDYIIKKDWNSYRIRVHALSSSTKGIGAERLSAMAKKLENLSSEKNIDEKKLQVVHQELLDAWNQLLENL